MWDGKPNLILIGMPGAGKSTVGRRLAKRWGCDVLDTDHLIEQRENCSLEQLVQRRGVRYLRQVEEQVISQLSVEGMVVATGGSVVYSDSGMQNLQRIGCIAYLKLALSTVERRLHNNSDRGMARMPNQSLAGLYYQRRPLYEYWADRVVDNDLPLTTLRLERIGNRFKPDHIL